MKILTNEQYEHDIKKAANIVYFKMAEWISTNVPDASNLIHDALILDSIEHKDDTDHKDPLEEFIFGDLMECLDIEEYEPQKEW